jgi:hypothetical protein
MEEPWNGVHTTAFCSYLRSMSVDLCHVSRAVARDGGANRCFGFGPYMAQWGNSISVYPSDAEGRVSRSRKHFDEFKPHSKHKHLILGHYFAAWGHKLGLRDGAGNLILYVDACAGRGIDELGNHGSPLIAAEAAASAESNVGGRRSAPFRNSSRGDREWPRSP